MSDMLKSLVYHFDTSGMRQTYAIQIACGVCNISTLLLGIASAQEYSIRANRGLNLRAAPSLNADIADTVRAGSILQVVGKSGSWLKINRSGNEVWLADWVNFSRLDSSEPSEAPQPTAPIDNCCFVDRQCQSDQEWIDGYWAYQHNECPAAPSEHQSTTPASPPLTVPTNGGNCCNRGWNCRFPEEQAQGYWVYQMNQCAGLGAADLRDRANGTRAPDRGFGRRRICSVQSAQRSLRPALWIEIHEDPVFCLRLLIQSGTTM